MRRTSPSRRDTNHISASDRQRYYDWKSGMGLAELATRHNVTLSTIERSIQKCRAETQRYSAEAAEVAVRQTVLDLLPQAATAIRDSLTATRSEVIKVIVEGQIMQESVDVPDHTVRLRGNDAVIKLLESVKINGPMVSVDARTQTQNVLAGLPSHASGQPSSAEAVIREIRAARGLALTDGAVVKDHTNPAALAEVDVELAEELEEEGDDEEGEDDSGTDTDAEEVDEPTDDGTQDEPPDGEYEGW